MQITVSRKMAKNDSSMIFCSNTVQENERLLYESCCKHQTERKNKEDLKKLFAKLNYVCQLKSNKEEAQSSSSWCNKNVISYTYGPILDFPPGSWWGIRMDCSRDRVHDPFDDNIQNGPFGVTSICTSSTNLNEDVDFGNSLSLTGQKYLDEKSEKDPLLKNYECQIPVRLIRSYNLLNEFAPKTGYRYDGLYTVTNFWIGVNTDSTKYYKFALLRLNDQEPSFWRTKRSSSANKILPAPYFAYASLHNCSENVGSGSIVQKINHEKPNGFLQLSNSESKMTDEKEKCFADSVIVTRHVFKKVNTECASAAPSAPSTSEKSLTHIGSQGFKAHNTNISIRTGLYDSSHSTQHDSKKSTLSPFCRTTKSHNLLKNSQHIENLNLSNKDKCKSLDGKAQIVTANEFPKRVDYISPNTIKPDIGRSKSGRDTNKELTSSTNETNSNSLYKYEYSVKDVYKMNTNLSETSTGLLSSINTVYKNEATTHKIASKETQDLQSLGSLDALTPDTILHLINKKCHPLSKLLMGNMIGLTSEQSIALKSHDLLAAQPKSNDNVATQINAAEKIDKKQNSETISDDSIGAQYYKFRRHKKLPRKMINNSEVKTYEKMHNEESQYDSVQTVNVLGQKFVAYDECNGSQQNVPKDVFHLDKCNNDVKSKITKRNSIQKKKINCLRQSSKTIKKDVGSKNEIRTRLRTIQTIKSSLKTHINRKQRREIANLLIDAKFGPKVRGPRNRRLRCINSTYAKQSYERCTLNKCQANAKMSEQQSLFKSRNKIAKMNNYKRMKGKQGREKQSNALKNLMIGKKPEKSDATKRTSSDNGDISKMNESSKKSKLLNTNIKTMQTNDIIATKNRRRKLTISAEAKRNRAESNLSKDFTRKDLKPCKADAITQCSLIKEPLARSLKSNDFVRNNNRNGQYTFIKIKYGDCKGRKKFGGCEVTGSSGENQTRRPRDKYNEYCTESLYNISYRSNLSSTKEQSKSSTERLSAFVPVNVMDSDSKIARLRSIGFKPIASSDNSSEEASDRSKGNCSATFSNELLKQDVADKYNKYTNEEDNVVVYMDDELQYQDIEDEDIDNNFSITKRRLSELENPLLEEDVESPWHGWKKVVTNQNTYWIGW